MTKKKLAYVITRPRALNFLNIQMFESDMYTQLHPQITYSADIFPIASANADLSMKAFQ